MKTQNTKLQFKVKSILELNNNDLNAVFGGTFSTNSESGPLCDMIEFISRSFRR